MRRRTCTRASFLAIAASVLPVLFGQEPQAFKPGDFQSANPNYPARNPFYFEGRIDWNLLGITTPSNAWEFAQRGIHKQDDLEDIPGAIADYQTSITMDNLPKGTCQVITSSTLPAASVTPAPCMFTVRLRLANLLRTSDPATAISLFKEVLVIDPLRLGVNALIGETNKAAAEKATDATAKGNFFAAAIAAFQKELDLSPVTDLSVQLTGELANNAHVHWALAEIYEEEGAHASEAHELDMYLKATQWHSDTYPWRIDLAKKRLAALGGEGSTVVGSREGSSDSPTAPATGITPRIPDDRRRSTRP